LAKSIKESLYRSTRWVVFEPNDERLWGRIRHDGFVKCDKETTTQDDVKVGIVNVVVGFAPLKPAEFVIIKVRQRTGDSRFDPYKNFQFRVRWEGRYVAGFTKVTAIGHRAAEHLGTKHSSLGRDKYEAITLERGITHDKDFAQWANNVSAGSLRKDIVLEVHNEAGELVIAYKVFRCWVSEFEALPDLDANANAVVIQHMKLENEGWERAKSSPPSRADPPAAS